MRDLAALRIAATKTAPKENSTMRLGRRTGADGRK
jgi:hypothetical protein